MKVFYSLLIVLGSALALPSCEDDDVVVTPPTPTGPTLKLTVQPTFGTQDLHLDSTYTTAEGYKVQFTDIKFYLQDLRNGSTVLASDGLFDYRLRGTSLLEISGDP
ncbi:MAG: hypothetical protein HRT57_14925, partial [Crocinitomicaceae bacterium]|nr:hypothetical protein [Crocinitomicaceae bacterium]